MILRLIDSIFQVYMIMLFLRIMGSWIPEFQNSRIMQFISFYTDPYLNIFKKIIPPLGMIDISPVIAFFCLSLIEWTVKVIVVAFIR